VETFKKEMIAKGAKREEEWNGKLKAYAEAHPDLAKQFDMMQKGELPAVGRVLFQTFRLMQRVLLPVNQAVRY